MSSLYKLIFLPLLFFIMGASAQTAKKPKPRVAVMAYYAGRPTQLDSFDVNKMTHLIYCFGHLQGNRFHLNAAKDTLMIQQMVALKSKNPALKVTLSFGGWGGCETCSDAFATDSGRVEFVQSVKEITDFFGTDGIDMDWEYPAVENFPGHKFTAADKENFTALLKELRHILGVNSTISFAAGGFKKYLDEAVEWKKVINYVDYINLMTYDLVSGYSTKTGHHTALYSTPQQKESTDNAVQYLLKKGIPARKLVIGGAFYARVWEAVDSANNGLYNSGRFRSSEQFRNFCGNLSTDSGYVYYWDNVAKAPYAYNKTRQTFATFDDARSMKLKTQYVINHNLGGIMFWQLSDDLYEDGLLNAIDSTKKNYHIPLKK